MQRMRRLFARARLEKEEVNILRGILSALEKRIQPQPQTPEKSPVLPSTRT
jgi:tRNA/rRNA methyltransferase